MRFAPLALAIALGTRALCATPQALQAPQAPQPERERIDVSALGPQVGERVPDFSLPDQDGRTVTLQSIMGPRGAMLVFVRSADW
jgi:hypothetical protein